MTNTPYLPDPMPFAGAPIDYAEDKRTPEELQRFVTQDNAQCLLFYKGRPAMDTQGRLMRVHPQALIGKNLMDPGPIFLGMREAQPIFAASLQVATDMADEEQFLDMRMGGGRMEPMDLSIAGRARSLFDWHSTHRFCANCGGGSVPDQGGAKRVCNHCQTEHFPRVNPVVIMLPTHEDKVLLGRGPGWPPNFMSALAGFVSPGETMEEAATREIFEETGVRAHHHKYVFCQPWPYPSQLMIGLLSVAETTEITIDPKELEHAQWYSRAEVAAVFDKTGEAFERPPRTTIAHQLLRHWLSIKA